MVQSASATVGTATNLVNNMLSAVQQRVNNLDSNGYCVCSFPHRVYPISSYIHSFLFQQPRFHHLHRQRQRTSPHSTALQLYTALRDNCTAAVAKVDSIGQAAQALEKAIHWWAERKDVMKNALWEIT